MALKFTGIQPVSFNDRECTPKLDTGKRVRLSRISFKTDAEIAKANEVLASCFPDDEEFVLDFITNKLTPSDKQVLRTYLVQGEKAIAMLDRTTDLFAEKVLEKISDGQPEEQAEEAENE